jgi:hypothetical protein
MARREATIGTRRQERNVPAGETAATAPIAVIRRYVEQLQNTERLMQFRTTASLSALSFLALKDVV